MTAWYVTYSRRIPGGGSVAVLLVADDLCHLILNRAPLGLPYAAQQEVGVYSAKLDARALAETRDMVEAAVKGPGPSGPAPKMGTPSVTMGIGVNTEPPSATANFPLDRPLSTAAKKADERLAQMASLIRRQPIRAVAVAAAWTKPEWAPQEELQLRVTLTSTGTQSVKVPNPAAAPSDAAVGVTLFLERTVPDEDKQAGDQAFAPLGRSEVAQLAAPGAEPGDEPVPVVTLAPGQELVLLLTLERYCYLAPGPYRGSVNVATGAEDIPEVESARGRVNADAGTFVMRA